MKLQYKAHRLVDFASKGQTGFRNNPVDIKDVPALVEKLGPPECFCTYFLYRKEIIDYMKDNLVNGKPSVSGFSGMLYAPYFFMDIDCKDIALARSAAVDAVEALTKIGLDEFGIKVYFSGSKGFHILADSRFFGIVPSPKLNLYFSHIRERIAKAIGDEGLIDLKIKDSVRLVRLPNTINSKSGLYKIRLYESEYKHLPIDDIKELAVKKRILHDTDPTGLLPKHYIGLRDKARRFYLESVEAVESGLQKRKRRAQSGNHYKPVGFCPAMRKIFESHIDLGERNECAIYIASKLREIGKNRESAKEMLSGWNERNDIGLPYSEIQTVIRSAYSKKEPYRFGCSSLAKYCPYEDRKDCKYLKKAIGKNHV